MKVAIVGAGIAGIAAARELRNHSIESVIFEKSRGVGGRVATRRHEPYVFDQGATSIAGRTKELEEALATLPTEDLVTIQKPIFVHEGLRVSSGDPSKSRIPRYTYRSGINQFAKLLSVGLDIRLETPITELKKEGERYWVNDEWFEALILTPPAPQIAALLWQLDETRPLANVRYRNCLSVMLGYARTLPHPVPYHAIVDVEQRHPLVWLSLESEKSPCRAPEGHSALVAQLAPAYSFDHYTSPDDEIYEAVYSFLERLYGAGWESPEVKDIMRWKYSQPENTGSFESANRPGSRLIIAGDGMIGGRIEMAFESGIRAAKMLTA